MNPPPAEMGEIISPGWAFFEVTIPAKGARMTVSSFCCFQIETVRSATVTSVACCASLALNAAGTPAQHVNYPTLVHDFYIMGDVSPAVVEAAKAAGAAIKAAL